MKNLILKTAATISVFSLSLFNAKPGLTDTYTYGSNYTRPEYLKVTFYKLGIGNSDFTKVFSVLDSKSGIEVDISDQNSINNMATGVNPVAGTYTHMYAVISNTYKMKGSANGCYTKNSSLTKESGVFDASTYNENGVDIDCNNCRWHGWLSATSDSSKFGEASLTDNVFGMGESNEPRDGDAYGPIEPSTNLSVGGNEVKSAQMYLTNSSAPFSFIPEGTLLSDLPDPSTRDRVLYVGELSSTLVVEEESKGVVQIYFDYSNGLAFDDDCDAIKFNTGDFDMSVITE